MPDHASLSDWMKRVEAEYREMPGLRLTQAEMRRFWGVDDETCSLLIAALVSSGFLYETPKRGYALAAASRY